MKSILYYSKKYNKYMSHYALRQLATWPAADGRLHLKDMTTSHIERAAKFVESCDTEFAIKWNLLFQTELQCRKLKNEALPY